MRLILASASPARLGVLRAAGVEPLVRVSGVDEQAVAAGLTDPSPAELVAALAEAKARAVLDDAAAEQPDAIVLGCDSMLRVSGQTVGKPGSADEARRRWHAMAGRTGELLTGHAVTRLRGAGTDGTAGAVASTVVRFGRPSAAELDAYLGSGEPLEVAGGFTLDGLGGWFVDGIDGDPSNVIGVSLPLTRRLLAEVGVSVADLWPRRDDSRPDVTLPR